MNKVYILFEYEWMPEFDDEWINIVEIFTDVLKAANYIRKIDKHNTIKFWIEEWELAE